MATTNPNRAITPKPPATARICLCSPSNHPGSFKCSLHRNRSQSHGGGAPKPIPSEWEKMTPTAKANSLRNFLLHAMIKPSSRSRRSKDFQPKPSRFSMAKIWHETTSSSGVAVS